MQNGPLKASFAVAIIYACLIIYSMHLLGLNTTEPCTSSMGAYYQTNGAHLLATEEVLTRFFQFYPQAPLHFHNDGGSASLKYLARVYGIRNYTAIGMKESATKEGMYFTSAHNGAAYLQRLASAALDADWILLLEDDVWIQGRVNTDKLKYDINGACFAIFNDGLSKFVSGSTGACYGGCGGHIVRSAALLRANITADAVGELSRASYNKRLASDELLSAVILMSGGTIGPYGGFMNTPWLRWLPGSLVVHQAKGLY